MVAKRGRPSKKVAPEQAEEQNIEQEEVNEIETPEVETPEVEAEEPAPPPQTRTASAGGGASPRTCTWRRSRNGFTRPRAGEIARASFRA